MATVQRLTPIGNIAGWCGRIAAVLDQHGLLVSAGRHVDAIAALTCQTVGMLDRQPRSGLGARIGIVARRRDIVVVDAGIKRRAEQRLARAG